MDDPSDWNTKLDACCIPKYNQHVHFLAKKAHRWILPPAHRYSLSFLERFIWFQFFPRISICNYIFHFNKNNILPKICHGKCWETPSRKAGNSPPLNGFQKRVPYRQPGHRRLSTTTGGPGDASYPLGTTPTPRSSHHQDYYMYICWYITCIYVDILHVYMLIYIYI